jgi:hypothetical protein
MGAVTGSAHAARDDDAATSASTTMLRRDMWTSEGFAPTGLGGDSLRWSALPRLR